MWADLLQAWVDTLNSDTGLTRRTIEAYALDIKAWIRWAEGNGLAAPVDVTAQDVKEFRDARENGAGRKAATVNRKLIALRLFFDFVGRQGDNNPARKIGRLVDVDAEDGRALTRNEWNAVRREAEQAGNRAEAILSVLRFAGPRVGEIVPHKASLPVPLLMGDLTVQPRSGEMRIRAAKGGRSRTVPLVIEARDPLKTYFYGERQDQIEAWVRQGKATEEQADWWRTSPKAPVFIGARGPLSVRAVRQMVAELGERAKLPYILGPHDLRATFITALLDPEKYGLNRTPLPLTVVARLAGHSSVETTARYAKPSQSDLLRWMEHAGD